jgi:hypothetical protein
VKPETLGLIGRIAYWTVAAILFLPAIFGDCIGDECHKTDWKYFVTYWLIVTAVYALIAYSYRSVLHKNEDGRDA